MNRQMLQGAISEERPSVYQSRQAIIRDIDSRKTFDIAVIGGGIHGALFARLSALNGLRTVLFEARDYASGATALSSVFSGAVPRDFSYGELLSIRRRTGLALDLIQTSGRLASLGLFRIPARQSLITGLFIRAHEFFLAQKGGWRWEGDYVECSGLLCDERRIILENIFAARQEGALCLNYASVQSVAGIGSSTLAGVGWHDELRGENHEIRATAVINCAGADAGGVASLRAVETPLSFVWQTDVVLDAEWQGAAQVFPRVGGRQAAASKIDSGTQISCLATDSPVGPEEVLGLLSDLPPGSLLRSAKIVSACSARRGVLERSGSFDWIWQRGMFTLLGGDFAGASGAVWEGFKQIVRSTAGGFSPVPLFGRRLPGAGLDGETEKEFLAKCAGFRVPAELSSQVLRRLGGRVRLLEDDAQSFEVLADSCLRGEVELALALDQAGTVDDILERRIRPSKGTAALRQMLPGIIHEYSGK